MIKITSLTSRISAHVSKFSGVRNVSCSAALCLDQKWREAKGLTENPNAYGPLTNLPDYTFLDGRPTPMGSNQKKRLMKQQVIAAKIVQLSSELDYAKKRHEHLTTERAAEKQRIMQNKLKPKGHLMLEKK